MTRNDFLAIYERITDPQEDSRFLLKLGFYLTISGRDTYVVQSDGVVAPTRLRGINELQHKIIGQVLNILSNKDRYPKDVFVGVLYDTAQKYGCGGDFEAAIVSTVKR